MKAKTLTNYIIAGSRWVFVDGFDSDSSKVNSGAVSVKGKINILSSIASISLREIELVRMTGGSSKGLPQQALADGIWQVSSPPTEIKECLPPKPISDFGYRFDPYPLVIEYDALGFAWELGFTERIFVFEDGKLVFEGGELFSSPGILTHPNARTLERGPYKNNPVEISIEDLNQSVLKIELYPSIWFSEPWDTFDTVILSGSNIAISSRTLCCVTDQLKLTRSKSGRYNIDPSQIASLLKQSAGQGLVKKNLPFFYKKDCIARGAFTAGSREVTATIFVTLLLLLIVIIASRRYRNKINSPEKTKVPGTE